MNWTVHKSLNDLYLNHQTKGKKTVVSDNTIQFLLNSTKQLVLIKNTIKVVDKSDFENTYEKRYKETYEKITKLLLKYQIDDTYIRFQEEDFKVLLEIDFKLQNGQLEYLRKQIIEAKESVRGISQMFFINDKYLDNKEKLVSIIEQILDVPKLQSGKDKQYLYVIPCKNPTKIVLCENLYFLKIPELVRPHKIELWYAGGYNVKMLGDVDLKGLPIYYSCDWDYDGLKIYKMVKEKIPQIKLLLPNGKKKSIIETKHKSIWNDKDLFINESSTIFNNYHKELIGKLIENNQWIIEESNDLISML